MSPVRACPAERLVGLSIEKRPSLTPNSARSYRPTAPPMYLQPPQICGHVLQIPFWREV